MSDICKGRDDSRSCCWKNLKKKEIKRAAKIRFIRIWAVKKYREAGIKEQVIVPESSIEDWD